MRVLVVFWMVLTIAGCDSVTAVETEDDDTGEIVLDATEKQMTALINQARSVARTCGTTQHAPAAPVAWNRLLEQAALTHSEDMVAGNFFSHTGSDGSSVASRVSAVGFVWRTVGENLYAGQNDVERAIEAWIESPGHCRNLMDPDFEEVGMAVVSGESTTYGAYWTQVFGTRL